MTSLEAGHYKDFNYVYFIENHINTENPVVSISSDYMYGELAQLNQETKNIHNEEFIVTLYRLKIYPPKIKERNKEEIDIKFELENRGQKFIYKEKIKEFDKDNYIYDLKFEEKGKLRKIKPPKSIMLSHQQQFEIFRDYLKDKEKIKLLKDKRRENLVICTQKLFQKEYSLNFYAVIFLECLSKLIRIKQYLLFDPLKVKGTDKKEIQKYIERSFNYINSNKKDPDSILKECKSEEEKNECGMKLFAFVLYFYYEYKRNEFINETNNNKENAKKYINKVLITYQNIFQEEKLTKEKIEELIDASETYTELKNSIQYADILTELLDIILTKFEKFKNLYQLEKKNNPKIDIGLIITPKKEDIIKDICEKYKELVDKQEEGNVKSKTISIFISGDLMDKYISYFEGNNLENLENIRDLINIKIKSKNIIIGEIHKDIDKSIFETALHLSKNGEMTNLNILDFLEKYLNMNGAFEILNGLNVDKFDSKFYEEWNKKNWYIFLKDNESDYIRFIENVIGLINDLKDFGILFKLLNISQQPDIIEINSISLEMMRNKFIELFNNYDIYKNKGLGLKNLIIELIVYSKKEKKEAEKSIEFLKAIQEKLNEDLRNDIYLTILKEKGELLKEEIINFIVAFYMSDEKLSAKALLDIILKCSDEIKMNFLGKVRSLLYINEEDFLEIENKESFIFFKGLLDNGIICNEKFDIIYYIKNAKEKAEILHKKLKSKDEELEWEKIYAFYNDRGNIEEKEKKVKAFSEKLLAICLNDEKESSSIKSEYDNLISKIKKISDSLKIILDDFVGFFGESQKENIELIKKYIKNLSSGSINYYHNNQEQIDELIKKYEKEAKGRYEKNKSSIFSYIYNDKKNKFKNSSEQSWINETETEFQNLKKIFENNLDKNTLQICLKTIKGKGKEEVLKELDTLLKLFNMDISKEKKEEIISNLNLLSKKEDIINIADALFLFIDNANLTRGKLWKLVEKIQKNKEELNNADVLKKYIQNLKDNNIDIEILYNKNYEYDNYINILLDLKEEPKAIAFILDKNEDDCNEMKNTVGDDDNALLNIKDIKDFEKCVKFIKSIGYISKMKEDDFFGAFKEGVKKTKGIEVYFKRYINIYNDLIKLFQTKFDKSATSKQKIISICENSTFILKNQRHNFFKCSYINKIDEKDKDKIQNNEPINIKIPAIKELRDRALLTKKVANDAEEKKNSEIFKQFVENVSIIFKLTDILKEIYSCGYIEEIEIKIIWIKNKINFKVLDLETSDSEKVINKLTELRNNFKKNQLSAYRDYPLIRYIYGRQINLIYDKIYKKKDNDILPLLKFISNNSLIKDYKINYDVNNKKDIYSNIDSYLKKIFKNNNIDLEEINEKCNTINKKDEDKDFRGIYCFRPVNLQKNVLQLYIYLTNSTPNAQYILFCNKETSSEELIAFLYRAILCKLHSCFIIAGIELLPFKEKITFQSILDNLYRKNDEKMKSCLVIAYTNNDADIVKYIHKLKKKFFGNILNELDNQNMDDLTKNIEIVQSDKSGVGKSTYIKSKIEELNKDYIYFPLGGVFTRKDILRRLKELNKKLKNNSIIHLDLYDTDQIDLTMELLFSLLITKIYGQNDDIFYLPGEIPIMVEIPNGFIDYMKKFPILEIFKNKTMLEIEKLAPLIVPNEINSNVQVVANYLKYLKDNKDELNSHNIFFKGISPDDWENNRSVKAKELSKKDCRTLILGKIHEKIEYPNYYQITSFINLLGAQLKKFSQLYFLSPQYFNDFGIPPEDIRSYTIETFIFFTKYFIEGGYINLVNNQTRYFRQMARNFDENRDNEEAIKELAQEGNNSNNLVSFNNIESIFLTFPEGTAESFDILANKNTQRDCKRYNQIFQTQITNNEEEIRRNNLNEDDRKQDYFLKKLHMILNLTNEIGEPNDRKKSKNDKENQITPKKDKIKNKKVNEDDEDEEEEEEEEEENENDEQQNNENIPKKTLFEIADNYVFTDDNYFKLVLILLRIRAQIPVIMMGETGCGKTSLIRKLSELIHNGDKTKMKILNIHAGTNDKDIIKFLKKKVIPAALKLEEEEEKMRKKFQENHQIYYKKKLWVFLDEINTCKSMGLISEILCKRTYQGNPIPENIAFIAACNPYRIDNNNKKNRNGLDAANAQKEIRNNLKDQKEKDKVKNSSNNCPLVYAVNPLPHSLLNFVFDFGRVSDEDEKKYIINIIDEIQTEYFKKYKRETFTDEDFKNIKNLAVEMIVESQRFIRENNDVSSVSLREIRRFNIFFEFFYDYLRKKKEMNKNDLNGINISDFEKENYKYYSKFSYKDIHIYSIILSVFVCYYLRIPENTVREQLNNILKKILEKFDKNYNEFLEIPKKEENFIAECIDLEKGIAKNKALLDNIFALFVTINTKVPIFIVGKPGCSKSLSVQLINRSMRGDDSKKLLFKKLPQIIMSCYQGSMGSTSKGVKSVFRIARNKLKNAREQRGKKIDINEIVNENKDKNKEEVISMIYFDEMGLAEHSPNNPLKVIHSELEYDLNEGDKKVAFVGISNWALDASKMNRGLFLSIPEPEKEDAKFTSFTIGESYDSTLANTYKSVYESLGEIYYDYKQYLMLQFNDGFEDFHGNRDFYHLVKNVARNIVKENTNSLSQNQKNFFIKKSIERNFAGLVFENTKETSLKRIKKYYRYFDDNVEIEDKYDVKDTIGQNIEDLKSRYLLVISKPSLSEFLLTTILKEKNKAYNYYKGSPFKDDHKSEEYILKILNKIQLNMEQEKVLILNNLGTVYPGLYDLFNQNFNVVGKKNYARIALGYTTNAYSLVNDNFRCIVNVDDDKIKKEEPPFLNRFEKHIISFENLLSKNALDKTKEIYNILLELTKNNDTQKQFSGINYNLKDIFINLDQEEINAYIYKIIKNSDKIEDISDISDVIIEKLSLLLPHDIILFKKYSGFDAKYPRIAEQIIKGYNKGEHNNFASFLKKMKDMKNVIYTFSDFFSQINNINAGIETDILGKINSNNITTIEINSFTSENKFEDSLNENFFNDNNKKLCIIKFQPDERHFLNYVKFIIDNKEKEINNNDNANIKKAFIFIVYLNRTFNNDGKSQDNKNGNGEDEENEENNKYNETISLTSEFYQIFIDDLNGSNDYTINDILNLEIGEILKKWIKYNVLLNKNIYETLIYMDFNISYEYKKINKKNYPKKAAKLLQDNDDLKQKINGLIIKQMEKDKNLINNAFKKIDLVGKYDEDIISCIQQYLSEIYVGFLNDFYYKADKDQFFSTLLSMEVSKEKEKNKINKIEEEGNENKQNDLNEENKDNVIKIKMLKKVIDIYLDNFTFEKKGTNQKEREEENQKIINIVEELGANKIDIILGLQLPGMFPIISSIVKKCRNDIIKKYLINESNLRKFIADEGEIQNEKAEYEKKLKDLNNKLFIELDKNDKINCVISMGEHEKGEFIDLFLEDYYTIFIHNNLTNYIKSLGNNKFDLSELKEILKFLVNQNKDNIKQNHDLETLAKIINWIETYSIEITYILKTYVMLGNYIDGIYNKMEGFVKDDIIIYEINEKCPEYTSIVNKALFNGFESILKVSEELYLNQKDISKIINMNKEILSQMNKFNLNLKLFSKELLTLQEIVEIINGLNKLNKCSSDNLVTIIKYYSGFNLNDNLVESFETFFNYLENIFDKNDSYYKIISIVFKNEFIKNNNNNDFKRKIVEIIINKNEYILCCYKLLYIILDFDIKPSKMKDNFNDILEEPNLLPIINNKCNNEYLEQCIFNVYDFLFTQYFTKTKGNLTKKFNEDDANLLQKLSQSIKNKKDKDDNTGIIFDLSFDIFGKCVRFLDEIDENNGQNNNLGKLYSISYIKAYLNQLVKFSLDDKTRNQMGAINIIIDLIMERNNNIRKLIKIYIIKLIYNLNEKNYNQLNKINFKSMEFEFIIEMLTEGNADLREIIEEKISPTDEKYADYPYLKYFIFTNYNKFDRNYLTKQIKSDENYMKKYPLIYKFLEAIEENKLKLLSNLEKYNRFCNFMVDNYSFTLSREEANEKKLKDDSKYKQIEKGIYNDFSNCWNGTKTANGIYEHAIIYKTNKLNPEKIDDQHILAYFLNDVNELGKGMYIAAGYEFFIKLQNEFLNFILENGKDIPHLKYYFENINNKIPIYEANNNQIILINSMFESSEYSSLAGILNIYSKRKIFKNDGTIDYLKYNEIEYDYAGLEEEIAKLLLPGKCLFEDENNLNFVHYWGEGFNGGKEDFLQKFEKVLKKSEELAGEENLNIEQTELTRQEKTNIIEALKRNFDLDDYKNVYGHTQLFIFYLTDFKFKAEDNIKDLIEKIPNYAEINYENFKDIFVGLKVKKIINVFLFIEQLCFDLFCKNLIDAYKKKIEENIKNKITDLAKKEKENIKELASAVRRFISRYLFRIKDENKMLSSVKLSIELKKKLSLWNQKFRDEKKINEILELYEQFNLTVGQSFEFYQLIKEQEEEEFNEYIPQRENRIENAFPAGNINILDNVGGAPKKRPYRKKFKN